MNKLTKEEMLLEVLDEAIKMIEMSDKQKENPEEFFSLKLKLIKQFRDEFIVQKRTQAMNERI